MQECMEILRIPLFSGELGVPYSAPLLHLCSAQKTGRKDMTIELETPARIEGLTPRMFDRAPQVNELTRAVPAGRPLTVPASRPHILARRMARWARRAAHA